MKIILVITLAIVFALQIPAFALDTDLPGYTSEQARQGKAVYQQSCELCHGVNLNDGSSPPITGDLFYSIWGGRSVGELLQYLETEMPTGSPGTLDSKQYRQVLAYMFQVSGFPARDGELSLDQDEHNAVRLPIPSGGRVSADVVAIPPPPNPRANPLDKITAVSSQTLAEAPAGDWLMWRRTYDAKGFSPLKNINVKNVTDLKVAWTWTMPGGRNISTPLVHDGVMFMYGAGSLVYAFDAVTGDILWRYERERNWNSQRAFGPRAISIYNDNIILTTDDGNIVALNVKTGEVVWDRSVLSDATPWFSGGTLVADEKILVGTASSNASGMNFIAALDVHTGDELWRFHTIPQDGQRGGDSWNGVAAEQRQGASVWVPGSYDPEAKLAFFGTGNTYRPQLLRILSEGASSNDGLYTNSTLALDIDTGKLIWHFQHLPNDQWNYDWAFERTVVTLPVNGVDKKIVITGGKQAIYEAMQVSNGEYQFSIDTGLQNVIERIDPITGSKKIAADALPEINQTRFVCPDSLGARNWQPTSFNTETNTLFTPYREACMKMRSPLLPGDTPHGNFGQKPYPRPDSDGNFAGLRAINVRSQEIVWSTRKRAELSTGILATAGGLIFSGSRDRVFSACDQFDGTELWQARLNGVPSGGPISFMIEGKQYIAVTTGDSEGFGEYNFGEGDQNPKRSSATIWVFALREPRQPGAT